ncbi:MAG: glycosyltransferase [Bacteroidota bacterium]
MTFTILLVLTTGVYAVMMAGVALAAWRASQQPRPDPLGDDALPRVAVLVAVRDEEQTIRRCLDALLAQDYPRERLTIYVANDHSSDRTADLIEEYEARTVHRASITDRAAPDDLARGEALSEPRVVAVPVGAPNGHLRGKANALHCAIGVSCEEVLLVTDADCAPPSYWARRMVEYLMEKRTRGAIAAQSIVEGQGLFASVQALDWSFLLTSASALAYLDLDSTAMGNNMALRRSAYEAVGGYAGLPFSVTEDYELWRYIRRHPNFETHFPSDGRTLNRTLPLARLRDLYMQRRRWARGGLRAKPGLHVAYVLTHLAHLLPLIGFFVAPLATLAVLGAKWTAEITLLWVGLAQGGRRRRLWAFPVFQLVLHGYMSTLPYVLLFFPRIAWKGRTL